MSTDVWMDKENVPYKQGYNSAIKKNETTICDKLDGPWEYHAKWNKSDKVEKDKYHMTSLICEI